MAAVTSGIDAIVPPPSLSPSIFSPPHPPPPSAPLQGFRKVKIHWERLAAHLCLSQKLKFLRPRKSNSKPNPTRIRPESDPNPTRTRFNCIANSFIFVAFPLEFPVFQFAALAFNYETMPPLPRKLHLIYIRHTHTQKMRCPFFNRNFIIPPGFFIFFYIEILSSIAPIFSSFSFFGNWWLGSNYIRLDVFNLRPWMWFRLVSFCGTTWIRTQFNGTPLFYIYI